MTADLTLEKLEIHKRLGQVEGELIKLNTLLTDKLLAMTEAHQMLLHGSNGAKGMVTRLDRIEQTHVAHQRNIFALWTAAVSAGVKFLIDGLRH